MKHHILSAALLLSPWFLAPANGQANVQIGFTPNGLSSLQYGGQQYMGNGRLRLNGLTFQTPDGQTISGDVSFSQQVDQAAGVVTQSFSWGSVTAAYTASANQLQITISTVNRSPNTITGLFFEAMDLQLPSKPQEYDGVIPILGSNEGGPTALRLTYGSGAVVLCNDDVLQPLIAGFPWALDRPVSTLYPIKINTAHDVMYPDNVPYINRPIAPGASDTYRISLRFGAATDTTKALAGDVYQAFAAAYPATLNWPDRRPIGSLIIGTSATGWATNPRGWLLDPSINVFTPQGVADFQSRLLSWADNAVSILKGMNAQGMITWDIEGEQYPQATTYIGDPRLFANLAPEMAGVADAYFKKFTDAGLRVGVCIRPQQLVIAADGSATQQQLPDPTQLMIDKMTWAKQRWGVTLFYVDSNGDPNLPYDFRFFRRVHDALPDVLVIPEHKIPGYYSATAPYAELRQGFASTPPAVRDIYPGAFATINTADGPINSRYADLQAAVAAGDIMMFRGWFDDGNNATIKSLYAGQTAVPPTVTILAPAAGSSVQGSVMVSAQPSAANGVAGVKLLVDNTQIGQEITSGNDSWIWDSSSVANGAHTLTVIVRDSQGQTGTASETVQVNNVVPPPGIAITSPAAGSTVGGVVSVAANASSGLGIASVEFSVDGNVLGSATGAPYMASWNSSKASNGTHTVTALAKDTTGVASTTSVTVNVYNAPAPALLPPSLSITSPGAGDTVSGVVSIAASAAGSIPLSAPASSTIGIATVRFSVDGTPAGSSGTAPYSVSWDSSTVANGPHTLTVTAQDNGGTTVSTTLTFTVSNTVAPASDGIAPQITITGPANNSTVSGVVNLTAAASDNVAVASVTFLLDNVLIGTANAAPYQIPLDLRTVNGGTHSLTAIARDAAGNTSTATGSFTNAEQSAPDCASAGIGTFVACSYASRDLTQPLTARLDPGIHLDPASLTFDNSVSWTGKFAFDAGNYYFQMALAGGTRLYVDGVLILDQWAGQGYNDAFVPASLTAGTHVVRMEYRLPADSGAATLTWWKY